ncbi:MULTISPECIES: restriction endonuclease subunit S [Vibrio]|uniref:restriction endonuclease subunit S n=1 Tax=Vibrio TaxID=662 RepID=UPI000A0FFFEB|nr:MULTISPECIES: restriction endonuclease subunit S [Vibrio]EGR4165096.1 restriction endonuclease subunit S [Vibrio cholerae]MCX9584237.1 restriction endonuclease subunit S [Vibrio cholerae]ORP15415.1 restriction endonuclease subunit S [Vibrio paracholerae]ORP24065.1 restriction endonuclease subunit S [Vibrio paracholerae]GHX93726.1 Type I restriction-modification system specificity [Vibrio cholerae]
MSEVEATLLPKSWIILPLSEVIQMQKGKKPHDLGGKSNLRTVPYINIKAFEKGIVTEYAPEQDAVYCTEKDVLLVWDGARAGLSGRGVNGYVGSTLVKVTSDIAEMNYLSYYFESIYSILNTQTKGVGIPHINPVVLNNLPFNLAPENEQARIVDKLEELFSELDEGVKELKAAQNKLSQYRQSLLKSAVEGSLTQQWRAKNSDQVQETGEQLLARILKQRREQWQQQKLAEFAEKGKTPPKNWQDKYPEPQKYIVENYPNEWFSCDLEALIPTDGTGTKTGPFGSLLKKHEHLKSGVPVVGIENIQRMKFVFGTKIHISEEKAEQLSEYELKGGDVVISRSGTVGEVCVIPEMLGNARFSTNIIRVRLNRDVIRPEYFCLLFNADPFVLQQIKKLCVGSTRDFLNTKILKSIQFILPPIIEQDRVLELLEDEEIRMNCLENDLNLKLKQSEAQRKNILKSAFSGQLVPQDPSEESASILLEKIKREREALSKIPKPRKPSKPKKKVDLMNTLLEVLSAENDWIDAQDAFRKCGIVDGTSTDRIEEIYTELRKLEKAGNIQIQRQGNFDQLKLTKPDVKED